MACRRIGMMMGNMVRKDTLRCMCGAMKQLVNTDTAQFEKE